MAPKMLRPHARTGERPVKAKGGPMLIAGKETGTSGPQPQGTGFGQHPE